MVTVISRQVKSIISACDTTFCCIIMQKQTAGFSKIIKPHLSFLGSIDIDNKCTNLGEQTPVRHFFRECPASNLLTRAIPRKEKGRRVKPFRQGDLLFEKHDLTSHQQEEQGSPRCRPHSGPVEVPSFLLKVQTATRKL